jgi:hypothetical protein
VPGRSVTGSSEVVLEPTDDALRWTAACRRSGEPITPFHAYRFLELAAGMTRMTFVPFIARHDGEDVGVVPWLAFRRGPFVVLNRMPFPYAGPLVPASLLPATLAALAQRARAARAVVQDYQFAPGAHVDPAVGAPLGFEISFDRTFLIDTTQSEDDLFGRMDNQTRRRVRKAAREGIEIVPAVQAEQALGKTVEAIFTHRGLAETGYPDRFPPTAAQLNRDGLEVYWNVATREGVELGTLLTLYFEGCAAIWVGGALPEYRNTGAAVAMCWDSIRWARERGAHTLDMVGLPDPGIERFKRQFGGEIHQYPVLRKFAPGWRGLQSLAVRTKEAVARLKASKPSKPSEAD